MAEYLMVSRRGIVHTTLSLSDDAPTLCGKGTRDLVFIGGIGPGERPCLSCSTQSTSPATTTGREADDA